MEKVNLRSYRSLFWPVILIGFGVILLLATLGIIANTNIVVLFRMWPLLLIAFGLDVIFGRESAQTGAIIGIGTVVVGIVIMFAGPSLGLSAGYEVNHQTISVPLGDARSAEVLLDLSQINTTITALQDSANLIEGEIDTVGELSFEVSGTENKTVRLDTRGVSGVFSFGLFDLFSGEESIWDIGLSPDIALDLTIDASSGSSDMDLSDLELTNLDFKASSGAAQLTLPASEEPYNAMIDMSSGSFDLVIADGADVDLALEGSSGRLNLNIGANVNAEISIDGGSGSKTIDITEGTAVQLRADRGSGGFNIPGWLTLVSGDEDNGTWETEGFSTADSRVELRVEGGSGSMTIR